MPTMFKFRNLHSSMPFFYLTTLAVFIHRYLIEVDCSLDICVFILQCWSYYLDSVRDEAEYGTAPEKQRKSSKKSSTKLDPFRNRRSGCEAVEAILCVALGGCILGQARLQIGVEPLAKWGQIQ